MKSGEYWSDMIVQPRKGVNEGELKLKEISVVQTTSDYWWDNWNSSLFQIASANVTKPRMCKYAALQMLLCLMCWLNF